MINKTYKNIHNKYSALFKFIFFLRHLVGIFFISAALFLFIPHIIDFKEKDEILKNYLLESYGLKINKYENIKYRSLPVPRLEIQNINAGIGPDSLKIDIINLNIYPKLINIYNYKNFEANKIILNKNKILLTDSEIIIFFNYIYKLKKRLKFKNLDLKIYRKDSSLIDLKKINFSNYGYKKNIVKGEIFEKKFKILINDNFNSINFKLLKTGITADIDFNEIKNKSFISGIFRSTLLNSKLKFNFDYDEKKLKIYNSYFRSKDLSFKSENTITYHPFFHLNSIFKVDDINVKILKNININKIFTSKDLIKKLNTSNQIKFKSKTFSRNLIDDLSLNINLTFGRLAYLQKISILNNFFTCQGDLNLLEEYPILYFDCSLISGDKKKLLKKFSIKYRNKNKSFQLNVKGNINILNNKINFKNITMNKNYEASKEDLNYFKQSFESILFDENFLSIFNYKKIREFILEVS
jgi:hypothetical protein